MCDSAKMHITYTSMIFKLHHIIMGLIVMLIVIVIVMLMILIVIARLAHVYENSFRETAWKCQLKALCVSYINKE